MQNLLFATVQSTGVWKKKKDGLPLTCLRNFGKIRPTDNDKPYFYPGNQAQQGCSRTDQLLIKTDPAGFECLYNLEIQ